MSESGWFHLDFLVIRQETDKAFQVMDTERNLWWIPKSQVCDPENYAAGDRDGTISITEWIAEQKGLG